METSLPPKKCSNLTIRILTSLILGPVVLGILYMGSPYFEIFATLVLLGLLLEWIQLTKRGKSEEKKSTLIYLAGVFYIFLSMGCLIALSRAFSTILIVWILGIVWVTDTAAYFCGKLIQGPKFAPKISPNKTWSGFIAGCLFGTLTGILLWTLLPLHPMSLSQVIGISFLLSVSDHLGDLFESAAKRYYGAKDTSSILPGHGGLLDRLDGLLAVSIVTYMLFVGGLL